MSERRAVVYLDDVLAKVDYHVGRDIREPLVQDIEELPPAEVTIDPRAIAYAEAGRAVSAPGGCTSENIRAKREADDAWNVAGYPLTAETPPEPARVWTADEAMALLRRSDARQREVATVTEAVAFQHAKLLWADLDPTARAATEGTLNVACAKLAALVGGAKC